MSTEPRKDPAEVENAIERVRTGTGTIDQAAAQCAVAPEALQPRIAAPQPAPSMTKRKSWSPLEVTFWLPY
jgi:hypothetical protein